jgi:hypothetical protein
MLQGYVEPPQLPLLHTTEGIAMIRERASKMNAIDRTHAASAERSLRPRTAAAKLSASSSAAAVKASGRGFDASSVAVNHHSQPDLGTARSSKPSARVSARRTRA